MNTENNNISPVNGMDRFSLNYLIREPDSSLGIKKAVILLHGVGSNEKDLFALANQFPKDFYIISARGPFTLGPERYAWYNVSFATGKPVYDANQETSSRNLIAQFIHQLKEHYKFNEIYLGGFSQGAIMSYSIGLTKPTEVTGVFSLGGRLLEEIKPFVETRHLNDLNVFIAHGIQDNTLPIHYAREAKDYLNSLGVNAHYREYNMGHQVSQEVLKDLSSWLGRTAE